MTIFNSMHQQPLDCWSYQYAPDPAPSQGGWCRDKASAQYGVDLDCKPVALVHVIPHPVISKAMADSLSARACKRAADGDDREDLLHSFWWGHSPQGYDYWYERYWGATELSRADKLFLRQLSRGAYRVGDI